MTKKNFLQFRLIEHQTELQKVDVNDDDMWKIEKIVKTRGKERNKHYFVRSLQYN
jgi:hypothetical protein